MTAMTDYLEAKLLDHVFRSVTYVPPTTVYLALFTADPTDTGSLAAEVSGGSYARQPITFAAAVSPAGTIANSAGLTFTNMPGVTVTHVALMDTLTGGNMLMKNALPASRVVTAGDNLSVAIGDLVATFA